MSLESRVFQLSKEENTDELKSLINGTPSATLYEEIDKLLPCPNFQRFLNVLFTACEDNNEEWANVKSTKIVIHCLRKIHEDRSIGMKNVEQVISTLDNHISERYFVPEHLVKICNVLVDYIQIGDMNDKSWKCLIPVVLRKMLTYSRLEYQDDVITGQAFNALVIKKLLGLEWKKESVIGLADMFKNIDIPQSEWCNLMIKFTNSFVSIDPESIPPLVYHLLCFTLNTSSTQILIQKLQKYYGQLIYQSHISTSNLIDSESLDSISLPPNPSTRAQNIQNESNTYAHIASAYRSPHIQNYLNNIVNLSKIPECILHPFNLTMLLMLEHKQRNILDVLKSAIHRYYVEADRRKKSAYIRENMRRHCAIREVFAEVIDASCEHRVVVLHGMLQLAFVLLHSVPALGSEPIAENMWQLGTFILITLIAKQMDMIRDVFMRINQSIASKSNIGQIVACFSSIVIKHKFATLQNIKEVKKIFDELTTMENGAIDEFLDVLMPLMRQRPELKEHVMLLLEKSLRSNKSNLVSVYLKFLKHLHISSSSSLSQSSSSSQYSISTQMSLTRAGSQRSTQFVFSNEAICYDVVSNLVTCLTWQVDVKNHLCAGLPAVVTKNKFLAFPVLECLWTGLKKFIKTDTDDAIPPLEFTGLCSILDTEMVVLDSISPLLTAIACVLGKLKQLALSDDSSAINVASVETYVEIFVKLAEKMAQCEVEHLIKQGDCDLTDGSPESREQIYMLQEAIKCCEAFITFFIITWNRTTENVGQQIKNVFKCMKRLADHLKNYQKSKKTDKKLNATRQGTSQTAQNITANTTASIRLQPNKIIKLLTPTLPLECIDKMIELLYCNNCEWALPEEANFLKVFVPFHHYIHESLTAKAAHYKQLKYVENKEDCKGLLWSISGNLFGKCVKGHDKVMDFDTTTAILSLEAFHSINSIKWFFNNDNNGESDSTNEDSPGQVQRKVKVEEYLVVCQELFDKIEFDDDPDTTRLLSAIVNLICLFVNCIESEDSALSTFALNWMKQTTRDKKLPSKQTATTFIACLLSTSYRCNASTIIWKLIALALGAIVGWRSEVPADLGVEMSMITATTSQAVLQTLINEFKSYLNDIAYMVLRIKNEHTYLNSLKSDTNSSSHEPLANRERIICAKLTDLVAVITRIVSLNIGPGAQFEQMLKMNINLFTSLTNLAKHFHTTSTPNNLTFQKANFDGLVRTICKKLQPALNDQIAFIEQYEKAPSKDKKQSNSKTLKGGQTISTLLIALEQFKKTVVQISKKAKVEVYGKLGVSSWVDVRIRELTDALGEQQSENSIDGSEVDNESAAGTTYSQTTVDMFEQRSEPNSGSETEADDEAVPPKRTKKSNGK